MAAKLSCKINQCAHSKNERRMLCTHNAAIVCRTRTPALFVAVGDGELVEVGVALLVFAKTYISPVASEDMNRRPCESNAKPTGRKQLSGHLELSGFVMISVSAVVLSEAATGSPAEKAIEETL
jgi:hypothetical protein